MLYRGAARQGTIKNAPYGDEDTNIRRNTRSEHIRTGNPTHCLKLNACLNPELCISDTHTETHTETRTHTHSLSHSLTHSRTHARSQAEAAVHPAHQVSIFSPRTSVLPSGIPVLVDAGRCPAIGLSNTSDFPFKREYDGNLNPKTYIHPEALKPLNPHTKPQTFHSPGGETKTKTIS